MFKNLQFGTNPKTRHRITQTRINRDGKVQTRELPLPSHSAIHCENGLRNMHTLFLLSPNRSNNEFTIRCIFHSPARIRR